MNYFKKNVLLMLAGALLSSQALAQDAQNAEMTYADREVSEIVGIPEGTVRSRLRRAMAQLRDDVREIAGSSDLANATLQRIDTLLGAKS